MRPLLDLTLCALCRIFIIGMRPFIAKFIALSCRVLSIHEIFVQVHLHLLECFVKRRTLLHKILGTGLIVAGVSASTLANSQTVPGAGNKRAEEITQASEMVQSAYQFIIKQSLQLSDPHLRAATFDALANPQTCIAHRANLTAAKKQAIVNQLLAANLLNPSDEQNFPGGLINGVFPPVLNDGTSCPHLPMAFYAAPGSNFGSHHSYPGGLPVHEANNDVADLNRASEYQHVYGDVNGAGIPIVNPDAGASDVRQARTSIYIDHDIILGAPLWHDWAKPIVLQWNADGTIFPELQIGGPGLSTGGHHILSLAEAMARGLSPAFIDVQACAHSEPTEGNESRVVAWIQAAAIIAQQDPIAKGYLIKDSTGTLRLPAFRKTGSVDLLTAGQMNLLAEMTIHNLSDADWVYGDQAVLNMQVILADLAPNYGVDPNNTSVFNNSFRNVVLAHYPAESIYISYTQKGENGVKAMIDRLADAGFLGNHGK
jgi:hypothetical protein